MPGLRVALYSSFSPIGFCCMTVCGRIRYGGRQGWITCACFASHIGGSIDLFPWKHAFLLDIHAVPRTPPTPLLGCVDHPLACVVQTGHESDARRGLIKYQEHKRAVTVGEETEFVHDAARVLGMFFRLFALGCKRGSGLCPLCWCLFSFICTAYLVTCTLYPCMTGPYHRGGYDNLSVGARLPRLAWCGAAATVGLVFGACVAPSLEANCCTHALTFRFQLQCYSNVSRSVVSRCTQIPCFWWVIFRWCLLSLLYGGQRWLQFYSAQVVLSGQLSEN